MPSRSGGFRLGGVHPTPSCVGSTPLRVNDPTYNSQGKRMSFASNLKARRAAPPTSNSLPYAACCKLSAASCISLCPILNLQSTIYNPQCP